MSDDAACGWTNNLPVVIVPGFGSSGLEVMQSAVKPAWERQRVWLALHKLGMGGKVGHHQAANESGTLMVHVRQVGPEPLPAVRRGLAPPLLCVLVLLAYQ